LKLTNVWHCHKLRKGRRTLYGPRHYHGPDGLGKGMPLGSPARQLGPHYHNGEPPYCGGCYGPVEETGKARQ
jgi:hypothetical protein